MTSLDETIRRVRFAHGTLEREAENLVDSAEILLKHKREFALRLTRAEQILNDKSLSDDAARVKALMVVSGGDVLEEQRLRQAEANAFVKQLSEMAPETHE